MKKLTVVFLVYVLFVGIAYAANSVWFKQTLVVPNGDIVLYTNSEKTTLIEDASDQFLSGLWHWNDATHSFNATIYVYNNGTSTVDINVTSSIASPWTFEFKVVGGASGLAPGDGRDIKLAVVNQDAIADDTTGSFRVTVSA